jgi:hypothetical protein
VFEAALSALRRAGFFLGFLLGVVLEGCMLAGVATASVDTAMSIYLRGYRCSTLESVRPVQQERATAIACALCKYAGRLEGVCDSMKYYVGRHTLST